MVDFRNLLTQPADNFKKPPLLPGGTYHGILATREFGESTQKKTPYVRFNVKFNAPGEDVSTELLKDIDLSKRSLRKDFYLTDDATYRLVEFGKTFGIPTEGRTLEEIIQSLVGQPCLVQVKMSMNQQTNEPFNEIGDIKGAA